MITPIPIKLIQARERGQQRNNIDRLPLKHGLTSDMASCGTLLKHHDDEISGNQGPRGRTPLLPHHDSCDGLQWPSDCPPSSYKAIYHHYPTTSSADGRRQFVSTAAATFAASLASAFLPHPAPAEAASLSDLTDVYFGVGCFWHIQHEFVEAERKLLGRGDKELTSLTGYAGGRSTDKEGRVCYHNFQSIADYGKLGHGEVVGMKIPESRIGDFAQEYFNLFTPKGGELVMVDNCLHTCEGTRLMLRYSCAAYEHMHI